MFSNEEWRSLILKLRQLTESGKITWRLIDGTGLLVEVGSARYAMTARDNDNEPPWLLAVLTKDDGDSFRLVDQIVSEHGVVNPEYPPTLIPALRDIAFRMSLGGPQLVRGLLEDLNQIDPSAPSWHPDVPF